MNRKEREMLQRKNDILLAAKKLFLKKGFDSVTMEEIAQKSEFTRITIYSYFKNKLDVFIYILFEALEENYLNYAQKIKELPGYYEKLIYFGFAYYEFFKKEPGFHLLINQYHSHHIDNQRLSESTIEKRNSVQLYSSNMFREIIQGGIDNNEFRNDLDLVVVKDYFHKSVYAIVHQYVYTPGLELSRLRQELEYLMCAFICKTAAKR